MTKVVNFELPKNSARDVSKPNSPLSPFQGELLSLHSLERVRGLRRGTERIMWVVFI